MNKTEYTAWDFNIYNGCEETDVAVHALNNAFYEACTQVVTKQMTKCEAFTKVVRPVMETYAMVGACDTDARDTIFDLFNQTVKKALQ